MKRKLNMIMSLLIVAAILTTPVYAETPVRDMKLGREYYLGDVSVTLTSLLQRVEILDDGELQSQVHYIIEYKVAEGYSPEGLMLYHQMYTEEDQAEDWTLQHTEAEPLTPGVHEFHSFWSMRRGDYKPEYVDVIVPHTGSHFRIELE